MKTRERIEAQLKIAVIALLKIEKSFANNEDIDTEGMVNWGIVRGETARQALLYIRSLEQE